MIVKDCVLDVPPLGAGLVTETFAVPAAAISDAGTVAMICVLVVDDGVIAGFAPKFTVAPEMNPEPFSVSVNAAPPAIVLVGVIEDSVSGVFVTAKATEAVDPPPGAGLVTVTGNVPATAMSDARIEAVSLVALTNVVAFTAPLKFTFDPFTKLAPFTVSVNPEPPSAALAGEIVVIDGAGLLTVKLCAPVVPPPGVGFVTVTFREPAATSWPAGIAIVSVLPPFETTPPVLALPPKFTTEDEIKFVPFRVSETPWPSTPLVGEIDARVGAGLAALEIVNVKFEVVPPPGAGFVTVTFEFPDAAISEAGIVAVNWEALTKVVALAFPLKFTTEA